MLNQTNANIPRLFNKWCVIYEMNEKNPMSIM